MDEKSIRDFLKNTPGAKRAAGGVLLESEIGTFYLYGLEEKYADIDPQEQADWPYCSRSEIIRLREIKTAHDYLLRIRAEAIANSPRLSRAFERRKQKFTAAGRKWSLTEYYSGLSRPVKNYLKRLPSRQSGLLRSLPSGFAPIQEANAICLKSVVGDIVIASEAISLFYYFMTICLHGDRLGISEGSRVAACLISIRIMNGAESQDFDIDPRCVLPAEVETWVRTHVEYMSEFTFAHEFGHFILGHNEQSQLSAHSYDQAQMRIYSQSLEFAADLSAVKSVGGNKDALKRMSLAAYNVMLALHLLELCADANPSLSRFAVSDTHPSAQQRIRALRESLGDKGQPTRSELGFSIRALQDIKDAVLAAADKERSDLFSFYGSVYIAELGGKKRIDRIDF